MNNDFNISAENFNSGDFKEEQRRIRAREAMKKRPASTPRLSDETNTYLGLAVFRFIFIILPLALLLTGIAVVPATEAIFNTEIGFWTAFFLLMTIRWLILQPRNSNFLWKIYEEGR